MKKYLIIILSFIFIAGCSPIPNTNPTNYDGSAIMTELKNDLFIEISLGKIEGYKEFGSFGERTGVEVLVSGVDIWEGPTTTIPTPNSTGEQMSIVSTSASDTYGGTGVNTIEIMYLDGKGTMQVERINLSGTTPVNTVATDISFVNKFHTWTVGTNGVAVGDIHIYRTGDATRVYSLLKAGGNLDLSAIYKVPTNYTALLLHWHGSGSGNKPQSMRLRSTSEDGEVTEGAFLFKETVRLTDGTFFHDLSPTEIIPEGSIIKISSWASQAGGVVSGGFDGILIHNDVINAIPIH